MKTLESERRYWILVAVILVIGLLCVLLAGDWAIRFAPRWRLAADLRSQIDPNSDFLTRRVDFVVQPLDPAILTQPVWIEVFLTPGAIVPTRVPVTSAPQLPTITPTQSARTTPTGQPTASPTNTIVFFLPSRTSTSGPVSTNLPGSTATIAPTNPPAATASPVNTPPLPADLQITKSDGTSAYTAGGTLTYTVAVVNNGPGGVTGALIADNIPAQVTSWDWACTSQTGGASGCSQATGNSNFSDTVNLPAGAGLTYTVTANVSAAASGNLTNTASVSLPGGITDPVPGNNISSDVDSPAVDLQITKTDGVTVYTPGGTLTYTVVVTNNSTFQVNGAVVTDVFPAQITGAAWTCAPAGAATCTPNGTGNINDGVNLPAGLSVMYTIVADVSQYAMGTLTNTASVAAPAGFVEATPGNNNASDSNAPASSEPDIGPPDGIWIAIQQGTAMTIMLSPSIVADGDVGTPDFVYYERLATPAYVELDWVQVEISSDGNTWYQVFYWGDPEGTADTNTNVDVLLPQISVICPTEEDNCQIPPALLYNSTGITVDIDPIVPPGNYSWIRITSPFSPDDDPSEVDAIQPYYP